MLRRTKALVASELPPKVETVMRVELTGAQADLYETIRLGMEKTVREALHSKGLAKSQITILDAAAQASPGLLRPALGAAGSLPARCVNRPKTGAVDGACCPRRWRRGGGCCCFRSSPACSA